MSDRAIEIFAGVVFSIVTIYLVIFSPISLSHYYSKPALDTTYTTREGDYLVTHYLPGQQAGWYLLPLMIVGFCMCMPIYNLFKGEYSSNSGTVKNESIWHYMKIVSIIYAVGVVLLYIFSNTPT